MEAPGHVPSVPSPISGTGREKKQMKAKTNMAEEHHIYIWYDHNNV